MSAPPSPHLASVTPGNTHSDAFNRSLLMQNVILSYIMDNKYRIWPVFQYQLNSCFVFTWEMSEWFQSILCFALRMHVTLFILSCLQQEIKPSQKGWWGLEELWLIISHFCVQCWWCQEGNKYGSNSVLSCIETTPHPLDFSQALGLLLVNI